MSEHSPVTKTPENKTATLESTVESQGGQTMPPAQFSLQASPIQREETPPAEGATAEAPAPAAPETAGAESATVEAATATAPATITLTANVGAGKSPNVISDLKQIQSRMKENGFLSDADYTAEGVTLLTGKADTEKISSASIPKTVASIHEYERVVEYRLGTNRYNKSSGVISKNGNSIKMLNGQIATPTDKEVKEIKTAQDGLPVTTVIGGDLVLAGKVGKVTGGNAPADLTAVQTRLSELGLLKAAKLATETPAAIKAAHPDVYPGEMTTIDAKYIPATVKAIEYFQEGSSKKNKFNHAYWKGKKFEDTDLSGFSYTKGQVAEGDISEFILSHYTKMEYKFCDAAGNDQVVTMDNFTKTAYTKNAAGTYSTGTADPANFSVADFKKFGITDLEARALLFVSKNEGKFNALNTYDRAAVSFGFVQFAGGTGGGTFPKMMANLKKDSPDVFKEQFQKYGIDVEYIVDGDKIKMATAVAINVSNGEVLRGQAAEAYIRDAPELLATFLSAGNEKEVQEAQVKTAVQEYVVPSRSLKFNKNTTTSVLKYKKTEGAKKVAVTLFGKEATDFAASAEYAALPAADKEALTSFTLSGEKLSDYIGSEKARAVIIDQAINMGPGGAASAVSKGMLSYIIANKETNKTTLKSASETDILTKIKPFAFVPKRVQKVIDDSTLSAT